MKMWSGLLSLALIIAMGIVYWVPVQAQETSDVAIAMKLLEVMEGTGATGLQIQMRGRTSLEQVKSPTELEELAKRWATKLEIPHSGIAITDKNHMVSHATAFTQDGVQVRFELTGVSINGAYDTYLVLQLDGSRQSLPHLVSTQEKFVKSLAKADFIPQFSTCIRGMYNVNMSVDQQEGRILSIFQALQANERERLADETVVSISGYTQLWKPFISLNGEKMNLQVATHRDSHAGTQITVGTPIITVEY
jgi:TATA-box binding